jgi:hypothetical protein
MSLTKAQLQAKLDQLEQENEALKNRAERVRFSAGLWPNQNRRTERDPAWLGTIRIVVHNRPVWLDVSQWDADPERYKQNPPDFSISLSETPAARASELEQAREKALAARGGLR